jgi:hypothetical protein
VQRLQAAAVSDKLCHLIKALTHAMQENATLFAETMHGAEAARHLRLMRSEATTAAAILKSAGVQVGPSSRSRGPSH